MELLLAVPPAAPALHPELDGYRVQFAALRADAETLAAGLDDAAFNWRSAPGRWSVGQCLQHLNLFGELKALPVMDRLIAEARGLGLVGAGPYRRHRLGEWFTRAMAPPPRRRFKTTTRYAPTPTLGRRDVLRRFRDLHDALAERAEAADGLDLGARSARNPALVRLTLGQWFAFTATHERRHLWQAHQVLADPAFPHA